MPLLAVNYHHIGLSDKTINSLNGISKDDFLNHLKFLKNHFHLIGLNDIMKVDIKEKNYCIITLDDGLSCHYDIVYQLMKEYDFPAAFFVSALNFKKNKVTQIHKFQYIRSQISKEKLEDSLNEFLSENKIEMKPNYITEKEVKKRYRYDDVKTGKVKYIINYLLLNNDRNFFINEIFNYIVRNEKEFVNKWYLSKNQIKEMHSNDSCIGSHAFSHEPLAKMNEDELLYELVESKKAIEEITDKEITAISYPLGNPGAVGVREGKKSKEAGYKIGFTMEREWNNSLTNPLMLARIDCNDLPKIGKNPLFYIKNNNLYNNDGTFSKRKRSLFVLD